MSELNCNLAKTGSFPGFVKSEVAIGVYTTDVQYVSHVVCTYNLHL